MGLQLEPQTMTTETAAALAAFNRGQRSHAYRLSLEATQVEPNNFEAWFVRSATAPSLEEKLLCLSRAQWLSPQNRRIKQQMYHRIRDLLEQDPFLAYLEETDDLYRVRNSGELILTIAKDRSIPERFPSERPALIQSSFRMLRWATLGLVPAGLGAVLLAPIVSLRAMQALGHSSSQADRVRAGIILGAAVLLFLLGLSLSYLLWLHLAG